MTSLLFLTGSTFFLYSVFATSESTIDYFPRFIRAMSDWENDFDDEEPVVPITKKKWDDEDVEDDIKDSWEESDEEEKPKPALAPAKKKVPLAQKIAERQAEEERKKAEMEAKRAQMVRS
jgi:translation initiation factor 3 subunit J